MAKQGSIKHYRQTGTTPAPPNLPYGEIAISKDGNLYAGNENNVPIGMYGSNLLDNADFAHPVNQRNVSGTITAAGYFIDRWKLVSGSVTLTANGLQLNGTMVQILEFAAGTATAVSAVYSGTVYVSYNNNNKTFTLTSNGGVIEWVKLEKGSVATPYVPKGYGAELAECMRYYQTLRLVISQFYAVAYLIYNLPYSPMRILPTLKTEHINFQHITEAYAYVTMETVSHDIYGDGSATAKGEILFKLSADL